MLAYKKTTPELWSGRSSEQKLYLHEKVHCVIIDEIEIAQNQKTIALLGYACDEGVKRNHGRIGAVNGPDAIRQSLAKFPNHLSDETTLLDCGTIVCLNEDLETTQEVLAKNISLLLAKKTFPIVLGGGHDIAYGHFKGIRKYLGDKKIGVINFDAHFDLRSTSSESTSGTPFYQIAQDHNKENATFEYLCLGIRKDANDKKLFEIASDLHVMYLETAHFNMHYLEHVQLILMQFIEDVDYVYTTIDLDGFSSAYAPGVSAPSPMGFAPNIVLESLKVIIDSKKLISLDIAEMNPTYDIDGQTAKLAASLVHYVMHHK
ncbi:formimidoylglutamase [Cellulophaga sp. HaHaR_3_176]|uniref:formimidoylglutamase n=1 Tax=Cellulophaga sp. HaHaR_3_176 TaxID=1942464 RepID=UPI001C1F9784|nr:formimidoylglutamase [Cellulophaga sp. HaHaR_3_176]QWX83983.1 formimidoylglutamase [Cellulophaga sp. HaHaR_3_176]